LLRASLPAIIRLDRPLRRSQGNFRFAAPLRVTSTDDATAIDDDCGHRATIHRVPGRRAVKNIRLVSPNLMTTEGQGCANTVHDLEL
jgi:hypothetical protein